ncbi:hypothetical protein [Pelistega sp. MC2]|uniref:hypothetical protein n=1 Tax=Pelistega sp. MC2 TaxID=1720297 RepID=UPI0008D98FC5|nr:hypothetical protein [Pelistega sp. MC2]
MNKEVYIPRYVIIQNRESERTHQDTLLKSKFYENGEHVHENSATSRIASRLRLLFRDKNIDITVEQRYQDQSRSDITLTLLGSQKRLILPIEVKGQWVISPQNRSDLR